VFNHRSVAEILRMIATLGGIVGCGEKADALVAKLEAGIEEVRSSAARFERRPRVYFEEWDEPQISCIRWVSELMSIAGGDDCFPELAREPLGKHRIIADPLEVPRRSPDVIFGSWCGKKFSARDGCGASGLERGSRRARGSSLRNQIVAHSAAWARGTDRRPRRHPRSPPELGDNPLMYDAASAALPRAR
jgi:iron complex transport system substrate-binding protein